MVRAGLYRAGVESTRVERRADLRNSIGGTAGLGKWITTLMYTEDEVEAESFKEVLLKWQSKHNAPKDGGSVDLIQIRKK